MTFTAAVSSDNGTPTGTVTFTIGGASEPPIALSGGAAELTTATLSVGDHTVSATYDGDASFNSSAAAPIVQTVKRRSTTNIVSSVSSTKLGQPVTFTATVSGTGGPPTGTVVFRNGGVNLASRPLSAGAATFKTSALAVGTHTITATYQGDAGFIGSSSSSLTHTVQKGGTTTTVVATAGPVLPGEEVEITATVAAASPASGTPAGTVVFRQGTKVLGNAPLVGGQAALTTRELLIGDDSVTARFSGSTSFNVSIGTANVSVDPRVGPEFRVNTQTLDKQRFSSVARLTSNSYVVTWESNALQSGFDIYGQRYTAGGAKIGSEFRVSTATVANQVDSAVTGLSGGGFVVVWQDGASTESPSRIRGQVYDNTGQSVGGELEVTDASDGEEKPTVARLTGGGFVVAWVSHRTVASPGIIHARRYDVAGAPVGGEFAIRNQAGIDLTNPSITGLTDGGFVATWQQPASLGRDIFGRRFPAVGNPGPAFRVNITPAAESMVALVGLEGGGGFLVAWPSADADGTGILARVFTSAGSPLGIFRANTTTAGEQFQPSAAAFANGGFLIAWGSRQDRPGTGSLGVYGQLYDAAGVRENTEFRMNTTTSGAQRRPAVSAITGGDFIATWTSEYQDLSLEGIYGQEFRFEDF